MSPEKINQNQILAEINLSPEEKRQELYDIIRNFRLGLQQKESKAKEIMQFAGSWLNMLEEDYNNFCEEIEQRRQASS